MTRLITLAVVLGLSACDAEKVCAPGGTQACSCPSGGQGAQQCLATGAGWAACECVAPKTCAPNQTQTCACPNGTQGAQTCFDDGSAWNPCTCSTPVVEPEPEPEQREEAKAEQIGPSPYLIRVVDAELGPSKAGGLPWDGAGDGPDVFVTISVKGQGTGGGKTTVIRDTTQPSWDQAMHVTLSRGDSITAALTDKDLMDDDFIGSFEVVFDGKKKKHVLRAPEQSIERLTFTLERE